MGKARQRGRQRQSERCGQSGGTAGNLSQMNEIRLPVGFVVRGMRMGEKHVSVAPGRYRVAIPGSGRAAAKPDA